MKILIIYTCLVCKQDCEVVALYSISEQPYILTGLLTLLFQVWFQNARAKFRRGQGDGTKDNGNEEGDNSPNPEGNNSNDEMMSDNESNELDR